jgi:hypothetical protein
MTEMTDSGLETLVAKYEAGAASDQNENELEWLNARSAIEAQKDQLTPDQLKRVKKTDLTLLRNIDRVQERVTETLSLADQRAATPHPAEEWWWYLDVLEPLRDDYKLPKPPRPVEQVFSTLFFVLEIVLLAVAAFVLARNLNLIPTPVAPTSTLAPTGTPAPTETLDPVAFDMSKATLYKDKNGVIEMQLPGGWTTQPSTTDRQIAFTYGPSGSESIVIQVALDTPANVYAQALQVTGSFESPKAALEAFKAQVSASGSNVALKWGEVVPTKIGTLDGQGLTVTAPDEPGRHYEFRLAALSNGDLLYVFLQARDSVWTTAEPVVYKMLDSLVVNPQNIPTATPTATLHPLLITATAVQKEIFALTPTNTPTATPTAAGTAQATGAATTGFPATETPAATAASTAASTVEAPAASTATAPAPTATNTATATVPAPTATSTATSTAEATAAATAGK